MSRAPGAGARPRPSGFGFDPGPPKARSQRNGIAVGTVRLLAHFGFATIGLTRIEIIAAEDNVASRRVALKSGATFECLARNRLLVHDRPVTAAGGSVPATERAVPAPRVTAPQ